MNLSELEGMVRDLSDGGVFYLRSLVRFELAKRKSGGMDDREWYEESHWRLGRVTEFFNLKEIEAIVDFLQTAKKERERESGG